MMRKSGLLLVVSLFLLFQISMAVAQTNTQGVKIGVIDIKRVINVSKYGQEVMEKLQKKYEELQAKLEAKTKELEALKDEIEKKGQLWSQEVREKKQ
ncbi:MAG: OmpH family outer membrane protein, partial [Caldimicrobium sp.]